MRLKTVTAVTLCACALLSAQSMIAMAQQLPPEVAAQAPASVEEGDPPGRVARLNYMAGTVTTEPAGASDWNYAQINRPLTTGDQLWNDENARSELHIGSTAVRLGSSTAMSILTLDDTTAQLKITQGTLAMRTREAAPGTTYEIDTPNAALGVTAPGDIRVEVAPDGRATTVTVRSGSVVAYGDGGSTPLSPGQQITFEGTNLQQASATAAPAPDAFDQWAASRDAAEDRSISARYVSRDIPGYQDLDANGTWRNDPSYGAIWVPNSVPADWAPYRQGHWVWQAPWGWTWVDDAPWGFAPYHYGRWAYVGSQWAWVPGDMAANAPPAYAPALVGFVGDGGSDVDWNVALTVGGVATAGIAWFALGPGEPWHPHYGGWSPRYYDHVNRYVHDDRSIGIHTTYVNYRAPRGLTAVPANAFVRGQPVGRQPYAVDPSRWRNPRFFPGAPGIAPTRDSFAPGARRADYRPPQGEAGRPVIATRTPAAPPAFHDALARQYGQNRDGHVPGVPAAIMPGPRQAQFGTRNVDNVRLVATHGPARSVISPREPMTAQEPMHGQPAQQGVPHPPDANRSAQNARFPGVDNRPPAPGMQRSGAVNAPSSVAQSAPMHDNGVPRPPQSVQAGNGAPNLYRGAPGHPSMNPPPRAPQQAFAGGVPNQMHAPQSERGNVPAMQPPPGHAPHTERAAPMQPAQVPRATPQPAPQPPHAQAFQQARIEPPRQQPMPMHMHMPAPTPQPRREAPPPQQQQRMQEPPHQPMQQSREMPHPQPQQSQPQG
jgi:hypothetical protein